MKIFFKKTYTFFGEEVFMNMNNKRHIQNLYMYGAIIYALFNFMMTFIELEFWYETLIMGFVTYFLYNYEVLQKEMNNKKQRGNL